MPWVSDFVAALLTHSWPGNVCELSDAMERLALLAHGQTPTAADVEQCRVDAILDNPASDHQTTFQF